MSLHIGWGHDFRPSYRLIERIAQDLPRNVRLLATTATANDRVMDDLRDVLGPDLRDQRGPLERPSLTLQTIRLPRQSHRLAWLAEQLPNIEGHGIIYTLTIRDAEQVAAWLQSRGLAVDAYHRQVEGERKKELEDALLTNRVKALVATVALGMGFDKPDLGFVIHYQAPGSVVAYYQQVGRAGRALETAYGVLLSGEEDTAITNHFIDTAFPTPEEVKQVIDALEAAPDGLSVPQLLQYVNITKRRIEGTLSLLSLEALAPLVKQGWKWRRVAVTLNGAFRERAKERLTRLRREEQRQMQEYVRLERGHMEFLIEALDGDPGGMGRPTLGPLPTEVDPDMEREALAFLRRLDLPITPRKQWPRLGGLPRYGVTGWIRKEHRAEEGRALCLWSDSGWGRMARVGKQEDRSFADELVDACASLVRRWKPDPRPEWVTCIPSLNNRYLVPEFARRLAGALELPFREALVKTENRPPQKTMANSFHQARNIDGSLALAQVRVPATPVLLVDDIVGSGWTFTVAA